MESSSPPRKMGDNFIGPWGILNFHLPLGVHSQIRGLKSFTFFFFGGGGGQQGFLYWGHGWGPTPHGQKSTHPSHTRKSPPVDSPQIFTPCTKGSTPTKYHFSCYNPIKTSFLAVVIAPVSFLSYLHTLCTHRSS